MKNIAILVFLVSVIVAGCSTKAKENNKWFSNETKALEYGVKNEGIKKSDVLEIIPEKGEKLVVFRFAISDGKGICIAHLIHKNKKYLWYRDLPKVILKSSKPNIGNLDANTSFKTANGEEYMLYIGVADTNKSNFTIDTKNISEVTPKIDKKTGMYYYIESK